MTCPPYADACESTCPLDMIQFCDNVYHFFHCPTLDGTCEYNTQVCPYTAGCCDAVTGQGCDGFGPYCATMDITCWFS